jgi:putative transcriptional regulator
MQDSKGQTKTAISYLIWSIFSAILWSMPLLVPLIATATLSGQVMAFPPYQKSKPVRLSRRSPEINALATGKLLIASQSLNDSNFSQTVVLLINYDQKGAMGLTINAPTEVTLAAAFPDIQGLRKKADPIFRGGPVKQNRMFLLLQADEPIEEAHPVVADMYVSTSRKVLEQVANDHTSKRRWRLYVGYAGWRAGQLESEVSRGDWHILPADAETVFNTPPGEIWPNLIRQGPVKWLWLHDPVQPLLSTVGG